MQIGKMRCVVPTTEQFTTGVGPVKAVGDDFHLVADESSILRELELIAVAEGQPGSEVPIVDGPALAANLKTNNQRVGNQAGFDGLMVFGHTCHSVSPEQCDPVLQPLRHLEERGPLDEIDGVAHLAGLKAGIESV